MAGNPEKINPNYKRPEDEPVSKRGFENFMVI
jgi:hypothetical protein